MKPIRLVATATLVLTLAGCVSLTRQDGSDLVETRPARASLDSANFTAADAGWPFYGGRVSPTGGSYGNGY